MAATRLHQGADHTLGAGGGNSRATTASVKPQVLCAPSQNGLLAEWPQRHNPMAVRPASPKALPAGSTISNSPSMRIGPLLNTVTLDGMRYSGYQRQVRTAAGRRGMALF